MSENNSLLFTKTTTNINTDVYYTDYFTSIWPQLLAAANHSFEYGQTDCSSSSSSSSFWNSPENVDTLLSKPSSSSFLLPLCVTGCSRILFCFFFLVVVVGWLCVHKKKRGKRRNPKRKLRKKSPSPSAGGTGGNLTPDGQQTPTPESPTPDGSEEKLEVKKKKGGFAKLAARLTFTKDKSKNKDKQLEPIALIDEIRKRKSKTPPPLSATNKSNEGALGSPENKITVDGLWNEKFTGGQNSNTCAFNMPFSMIVKDLGGPDEIDEAGFKAGSTGVVPQPQITVDSLWNTKCTGGDNSNTVAYNMPVSMAMPYPVGKMEEYVGGGQQSQEITVDGIWNQRITGGDNSDSVAYNMPEASITSATTMAPRMTPASTPGYPAIVKMKPGGQEPSRAKSQSVSTYPHEMESQMTIVDPKQQNMSKFSSIEPFSVVNKTTKEDAPTMKQTEIIRTTTGDQQTPMIRTAFDVIFDQPNNKEAAVANGNNNIYNNVAPSDHVIRRSSSTLRGGPSSNTGNTSNLPSIAPAVVPVLVIPPLASPSPSNKQKISTPRKPPAAKGS